MLAGLVDLLGMGGGRRVLCPSLLVVGLEEPPVVSKFLRDLTSKGWVPVQVNKYKTRWVRPEFATEVVLRSCEKKGEGLDAIVFTNTREVEGLLKSLRKYGSDWKMLKERCLKLVEGAWPSDGAWSRKIGNPH